ncbi:MAG: glycosyltransferase [Gammaproteobacteria bacterium]|nr:glycosyltransferase [Gammaproteobacteria bacterium]
MTKAEAQGKALDQTDKPHRLSIVIPIYNEEETIPHLVQRVHEALADYRHPWELILVDDGSRDDSVRLLNEAGAQYGPHVRVVDLQRNFGQTAAMQAGIDAARGDVIATLDGDLQNDPIDIPRMVKRLLDEDLDLVAGRRLNRQDNLIRKIPSYFANRLIVRVTGVELRDYGCTLKIFRTRVLRQIRLYGEMHRFIPAWIAATTSTKRIKEEVVSHHARKYGQSKYGLSRIYRVLLDLLSVYFFMRFKSRPSHFFGRFGIALGTIGGLLMTYLLYVKIILGEDIGNRPMLLAAILLIVVAVQFFTTGVLSEMISHTYYESTDKKAYIIREPERLEIADDQGWKTDS